LPSTQNAYFYHDDRLSGRWVHGSKIDKTRFPILKTRDDRVKILAAIEKIRFFGGIPRRLKTSEIISTFNVEIMRPDYSHKIFDDKRLRPYLRLETRTRVRSEACVRQ